MAKSTQNRKGGGARKIGRQKRHQAQMYASEARLDKNRKRRMRRHLRDHPLDSMSAKLYAKDYGELSFGLTALGKRRAVR